MIRQDASNPGSPEGSLIAQVNARYTALRALGLPTYEIQHKATTDVLHCLCCGLTSYNPTDVAHAYCHHCQLFHEEPAMTISQLKIHYETLYRTLQRERTLRERPIYKSDRDRKVAEIDTALAALTAIKDELKARLMPETGAERPLGPYAQEPLFDLPKTEKESTGYF